MDELVDRPVSVNASFTSLAAEKAHYFSGGMRGGLFSFNYCKMCIYSL